MNFEKRTDHFASDLQEEQKMLGISQMKGDLPIFCAAWGTLNPISSKGNGLPNECAPSGQILGIHE